MKCPKCGKEELEQVDPGIDTLQDDSTDTSPEDTFVVITYNCPNCDKIEMFYDYTRTESKDDKMLHENPLGKKAGAMNLPEAKKLFEKHHPEETHHIKNNTEFKGEAGCTWHGFKSALTVTGQLED